MSGRGKKLSYDKNARAHAGWMEKKRQGRPKQVWVWDEELINMRAVDIVDGNRLGHWEKVSQ